MKRIFFFICCLLISLQMFAQSEMTELFPTLAGLERTVYVSYWEDCCGKSQSAHIAPRTEIDTINGKPYLRWGGFFLREENNQVLIYSFAYEGDLVLYDWSLEIGDSLSLLALDQYSFSNIEYPVVVDYEFYIDDSELDEDGINQAKELSNVHHSFRLL